MVDEFDAMAIKGRRNLLTVFIFNTFVFGMVVLTAYLLVFRAGIRKSGDTARLREPHVQIADGYEVPATSLQERSKVMSRFQSLLLVLTATCLTQPAALFAADASKNDRSEQEQVVPGNRPSDKNDDSTRSREASRPRSDGFGDRGGPGRSGDFGRPDGPGGFGPPPDMGGFGPPDILGGFGPGGFGRGRGPGGFGPPGGPPGSQSMELVAKFDADKDGRLNAKERAAAREYIQKNRSAGRGRGFPGFQQTARRAQTTATTPLLTPSQAKVIGPNTDLYDEKTLRTLYLRFADPDWYEQLGDFYRTDVEVPADLIVDGTTYPSVGVRFRGNTSYMFAGNSEKKPLNITIDYADKNQRLYGYRTLNLLNGSDDPTFLREALYSRISRAYTPAIKANFVKLAINGENWGVYTNSQQFNRDFLKDWFGTDRGARWKISMMGPGGGRGALTYEGDDPSVYKQAYELKSKDDPGDWTALINLCKSLNTTPADRLEDSLNPILNVDQALWLIALESIFIDEGYVTRGADYALYRDGRYGRFHLLSIDNNETFRFGGGPGFRMGGSGAELSPLASADDESRPVISRLLAVPHLRARYLAHVRTIVDEWLDWNVLAPIVAEYQALIDAEVKADAKKLYTYEAFAQGHIQDVKAEGPFGGGPPMFGGGPPMGRPQFRPEDMFQRMDVNGDGRITSDEIPEQAKSFILQDDANGDGVITKEEFGKNFPAGPGGGRWRGPGPGGGGPGGPGLVPSLKRFVEERRAFLLKDPEVNKPRPVILDVARRVLTHETAGHGTTEPLPTDSVHVQARIGGEVKADSVLLYYAEAREAPFKQVAMFDDGKHGDGGAGDGLYAADIPPFPAGTQVHYYVEARSPASVGTTTFFPPRAELGAATYRVATVVASASPIVINELMAANVKTIRDPQGEYDDWIELLNVSDREVDLSGMYLSDRKDNPRKWRFPKGATLAPGAYLIVWCDDDGKAKSGLHANFKMSKSGETVLLLDADERGNALLDSVTFGEQQADVAWGRLPDGKGAFRPLPATPGKENREK